jgi:hypothetical protein
VRGHVHPALGLVAGLLSGLGIGLIGSMLARLDTGLGTGRRSQLIAGAGSALVAGPAGALAAAGVDSWSGGLEIGLYSGLAAALVVALQRGGATYLRYHLLRWLAARQGIVPFALIDFLEYATSVVLLQRQGAGYHFVHALLFDLFVTLESAPDR